MSSSLLGERWRWRPGCVKRQISFFGAKRGPVLLESYCSLREHAREPLSAPSATMQVGGQFATIRRRAGIHMVSLLVMVPITFGQGVGFISTLCFPIGRGAYAWLGKRNDLSAQIR